MPDSSKAAAWFTRVAVEKFKEQAKLKRFMIKDFNDAVRTSSHTDKVGRPTHDNWCNHCKSIYNMQSRPSSCSKCSNFFHKGCLNKHMKLCRSQSQLTTTSPMKSVASSSSLGYACEPGPSFHLATTQTYVTCATQISLIYSHPLNLGRVALYGICI